MERIYEKSCGSKYAKKEMVGEMDAVSWNEKNNPTRNRAVGERDPKKVGKSTSAYAVNENGQLNENDMVVSYRKEKIPIKFTGFKAFDGRDGSRDTTRNDGTFVVTLNAERTDGEKLGGKEKFDVNIMTNPGVTKISQDGTVPFPDFDQYQETPEVKDFGKTIDFIKKNINEAYAINESVDLKDLMKNGKINNDILVTTKPGASKDEQMKNALRPKSIEDNSENAGPGAKLVRFADLAGGSDKDYKVENGKIVDVSLIEDK